MKRTFLGISAALLLLGTMLYPAPARANNFLYDDVVCGGGLKLSHASGVPGGDVHTYVFGGVCSERAMYQKGPYVAAHLPLAATARWDNSSRTYSEHLHFLAADTIVDCGGDHPGGAVFCSSTPVTTDPEDATFKCDEDPVINKGAHCSLVSQHNGTGWDGFSKSEGTGQPRLLGLATASQASAFSKQNARISCSGLHLTAATGAPNGKKRTYKFGGTCELYHTPDGSDGLQVTHVLANGKWDALAQQAVEGVTVLTKPNEGGGSWSTKYTCTDDPWLNPHANCSKTFQLGNPPPVYDPITDILDQHPITMGLVNAKQAAQLSKSHKGSSKQAKMQPIIGFGHHGNIASSRKTHLSGLAKPRLTISTAVASRNITMGCRPDRLIDVSIDVQNTGSPLSANTRLAYIHVEESGGASLKSQDSELPAIAAGQTWYGHVMVGTSKAYFSSLPGEHILLISIGPSHADKSKLAFVPPPIYQVTLDIPAGYCQQKLRMGSPAGMRMQPNAASRPQARPSEGMHVQPKEEEAPTRRMSLPAVQLNR
jgi:hypothetical protein